MKFYTRQHGFYCGVDLHASTIYILAADAVVQFGRAGWPTIGGVMKQILG